MPESHLSPFVCSLPSQLFQSLLLSVHLTLYTAYLILLLRMCVRVCACARTTLLGTIRGHLGLHLHVRELDRRFRSALALKNRACRTAPRGC